jgi:hypothetical protein
MFYALFSILILLSCGKEDAREGCEDEIKIDTQNYASIVFSGDIISMSISEDCLAINIGFSGCDDNHEISMVTDGAVAESFPVQVHFKLSDANPQACLAYFTKEYHYDLNQLNSMLTSEPKARLIFSDHGKEILWERK